MKTRRIGIAMAALCAPLLWGCASGPQWADTRDDGVDTAKIALVNHVAAAQGVQVIWLNLPRKAARPGS